MDSHNFIKTTLKFCIPTIVAAIVAVLVLPLVSRVYPESEYGYISNFYSIGNMLMGIVFLGLDSAYIRFFNEPPMGSTRNGLYMFTLRTGLTVTLCGFILALLLFPTKISQLLFNENETAGVILLFIYIVELVFFRLSNINFRFSDQALAYNIQQTSFVLCNKCIFLLAVVYSSKYIYSVIVITIGMIGIVGISLWVQRSLFRDVRVNKFAIKEMIEYAVPIMPATIITLLNNSIAKLMLGGLGMRDEVGRLAIATSLANIFAVIPNAFSVYWGPFMYKYYSQEQRMIKNIHDIIMLLSIILTLGIFLFQDIMYKLLGMSYRSSQGYFMLIMLNPISIIIGETTSYGIGLARKTRYVLLSAVVGCMANVIACFVLIPRFGVYGAAVGVALSATIIFITKSMIAQHYYISIWNRKKTMVMFLLIWGIAISNTFMYKNIIIRIWIGIGALLIAVILYWRYIIQLLKYIKNMIIRHK